MPTTAALVYVSDQSDPYPAHMAKGFFLRCSQPLRVAEALLEQHPGTDQSVQDPIGAIAKYHVHESCARFTNGGG